MAIIPGNTRFIGISPTVDLTEKKSARLNSEQEPYTMADFQESISPDLAPISVDGESVGIAADPTATTQSVAVIESTTTNAGIVLKPNGTGAIMASVPDGTAAGGDARGQYSVDLQRVRSGASQVASGNNNFMYGENNRITAGRCFIGGGADNNILNPGNYGTIIGGYNNNITNTYATILGGTDNTASSLYGVISGGQSNTASTNTHATVVGGQSNVSSGQHSITGGNTNIASAIQSICIGGQSNTVSERYSVNIGGQSNTVAGRYSATLGGSDNINGKFNQNGNVVLGGQLNQINNGAGGNYSVIQGWRNTLNGTYSGAFGRDNSVSSDSSFAFGLNSFANKNDSFALGSGGASYMVGMLSHGNGSGLNTPYGYSAQSSEILATNQQTVESGGTIILYLDGATATELIQPNNKPSSSRTVYNTFAKWVAIVQSVSGTSDVAVGDIITSVQTFTWKDILSVSSIVGSVTTVSTSSDTGMATASMSYSIGASQELVCTFTAPTFTGAGATVRFKVLNVLQWAEMSIQ